MLLAWLGVAVQGCAGGESRREAFGLGRVDDPTFGLPKYAEFRNETPIQETVVFRDFAREADVRRVPPELRVGAPAEAWIDPHPSWRADFPVERVPSRGKFFLSGFTAGFLGAMTAGAAVAAVPVLTGRRLGFDISASVPVMASVTVGALTGLVTWGFSYAIPPTAVKRKLSRDRVPDIEETGVYREWSSPPK